MVLNKTEMNNKLYKEWLNKYTALEEEDMELLLDLKEKIQENLEFVYEINKTIVVGQGYLEEKNIGAEFLCKDGVSALKTDKGSLVLENEGFRTVIAAFIDVYEDVYPLGTVVDLKKQYYKDILPVDEVEHIRVVISYRYIPCSESMYIPYMGNIYPIGNTGIQTNGIHFTPKTIEKVVHMGFIDEEEMAFLFQRKYEMLLENNMHSTGFATKEEMESMSV